jgi:hypothetical protein
MSKVTFPNPPAGRTLRARSAIAASVSVTARWVMVRSPRLRNGRIVEEGDEAVNALLQAFDGFVGNLFIIK